MIDQLGAHLGKRIVLGYDRHLLPEVDGYVAHLAAYGMVVTDTDPERLHYLSSAERVCRRVRGRADAVGVLACMTGIGVSIAANKFGGVYAARCLSVADAEMARTINNANVLCLAISSVPRSTPRSSTPSCARLIRGGSSTSWRACSGSNAGPRTVRVCVRPSPIFASRTSSRSTSRRSRRAGSPACSPISTARWSAITSTTSPSSVTAWVEGLRAAGIGVCIVSNSGPARVAPVAAVLDVPYVANAAKPLRRGIDAGLRTLARPANDVALVGDQLFTDVWGGRRSRLLTILVEPRSADQTLLTRLKRPLEWLVDGGRAAS
jgi:HAD superfamily phosphatase (TIGR01668 family)